ncbi:MAG: TlyA family RNA methyltransferase [Nitrospirae bacterium]|nr:MAG: TlyA family RNA methyltransferase [Nitrospirota bacterium]
MTAQKKAPVRERLDRALVARGLAASREQAAGLIMAGAVTVDGAPVDKQAKLVAHDARIEVASRPPYASRAGGKLAAALASFKVVPTGLAALDVGASTGGFTDCLLQGGARIVYAVDVGFGQLDWKLRQDPRVVVLDRCNIRYLDPAAIPEPIDLAVIDVSFISLTLVLPCVVRFLREPAWVIALVKPQFEVGKGQVGRGGIVRDDAQRQAVTEKVLACAEGLGLVKIGVLDSPVPGQKGNREILVGWRYQPRG